MLDIFIEILKYTVLITGIFDAYKYRLQAVKIGRLKSSGQVSRLSLLYAISHRIPLLLYVWLILQDKILIIISCIALYTITEAFYSVYLHYPYRNRGLKNFKRPSIWVFIKDTLSFKNTRKRL